MTCAALTAQGQAVCEAATDAETNTACHWGVPGGTPSGNGGHCVGPMGSGCDVHMEQGPCEQDATCNWNSNAPTPGAGGGPHCAGGSGCPQAADEAACNNMAGCNWVA